MRIVTIKDLARTINLNKEIVKSQLEVVNRLLDSIDLFEKIIETQESILEDLENDL